MSAESYSPRHADTASRAKPIGCPAHTIATDADDSAVVIGLALAYVKQCPSSAHPLPAAVLHRLDALADLGDPTCRLVRDWLDAFLGANQSTHPSRLAEMISLSKAGEVR
jgi:hypothetical protein